MGQQVEIALKASMHSVIVKLVSFLPGLLALIVAVALLAAVGAVLAFILRRVLTSAKFDDRFANRQSATMADWSPAHSPTELIARTAFWGCILLGVIVGISAFDASYAGNAEVSLLLIPFLSRAVGAVFLLVLGTVAARYLSRSVLIGAVNSQLQYARFLALGVKWLVLVLTAAMAIEHLQIGGTIVALAFGILFGGIVLTLALAIGLGSRELVSRSLEKTVDLPGPTRVQPLDDTPPAPKPTGTLRHF